MKNTENYSGIKFMTSVNNIVSALFLIFGIGASLMHWERDPIYAIGGVWGTIFVMAACKSTIEVMTAIREIAINTRKDS